MTGRQSAAAPVEPAQDDVRLLMEFSRAMVGLSVRSLGAVDGKVTLPQFRSLAVLERSGPCNVSGLAENVGLHISTVTRICDKLVELSLITREPRPDNRREIVLANTRAGSRLVAKVWRVREAALGSALARLAPPDRESVARALPLLLDVLGESVDGPDQSWG